MGAPMARRLAAQGHEVTVWNRTASKAQALSDVAQVEAEPTCAVKSADVIISMLFDGNAVWEVFTDNEVADACLAESIVVDMSSTSPQAARQLAEYLKYRSIRFMDAPVSGGVEGAKAGNLRIFAGGSEADFAILTPIFQAIGRAYLMGDIGAGQLTKLVNQAIVATTIGAVAEGLYLAEASGCDPALVRNALQGGFADSRILDLHGARMVAGDFEPGGRSSAQLKDLVNVLDLAQSLTLDLPLVQSAKHGFDDFVTNHQGGDYDHSAYYLWLQKHNKN